VAAGLVFCALGAVTLYLRPRAWRCLAGALISFLAALLPVGINRIRRYGVYDGAELYYQQAAQFMFFVFCAFALSSRWGGRRERPVRLPRLPILAAVGLAAAVAYGFLYVRSVHVVANAYWEPNTSRNYFRQFSESVNRVKRLTGREPNLVDTTVGPNLMTTAFYPFNRYSQFFAFLYPRLRYDDPFAPAYVAGLTGRLQPVRLKPVARVELGLSTVSNFAGTESRPASFHRRGACVPPGPVQRLHIPLSTPRSIPASAGALPYAVEISYRLSARVNVIVTAARSGGPPEQLNQDQHLWGPGAGTSLVPVESPARASEIDVNLAGGSCVTRLTLGAFVPRG
jgi:hypothetical protein